MPQQHSHPPQSHQQQSKDFLARDDDRITQAIIIADSFNERFMPITLDKPRCLLPLLNVPIIEYTCEFLAVSGIQEVILFCRSHADQIKDYISKSRWSKPTSSLSIQVILSPECSSLGDALRDIDGKSLITGDFVLCSGDVVSNMNLSGALLRHQLKRKADKNVIMTMLLKQSSPVHRTREHCEGSLFVLDRQTNECLSVVPIDSEVRDARHIIPLESLSGKGSSTLSSQIGLRYDLMDCEVDICAQNVLALFTENFDYQDLRGDFCRGVLQSDLLGHRIMAEVVEGAGYAARVRNSRLYDAISRDIIGRWTFPIVPDSDLIDEQPYKVLRGMIYQGEGVLLARSAVIGNGTVLGRGVSVGEGARISRSVLGPGCQIGAGCVIEGAYLWEGVVVEANAAIKSSIIADRTRVLASTVISPGCLITSDVILGPKITLPPNTRIAKWSDRLEAALQSLSITGPSDEPLDAGLFARPSAIELGVEADGVVWEAAEDGHIDDVDADVLREERKHAFTISGEYIQLSISGPLADKDDIFESDSDEHHHNTTESIERQNDSVTSPEPSHFMHEAYDMARNSITLGHSIDNAALELNSLKFACNSSFTDCRRAVISALLSLTDHTNLSSSVTLLWGRWAALLNRFCFGEPDQVDILNILAHSCLHPPFQSNEKHERAFQYIVPVLYQHDVLDEDVIITWQRTEISPELHSFQSQLSRFVDWLEQSDDDDDSSTESH